MNRKEMREARKLKKLSAEKLGALVGVSGRAILLYETGERNPRPDVEIEICRALDLPLPDEIKYILSCLPDTALTEELCNRGYKIRKIEHIRIK